MFIFQENATIWILTHTATVGCANGNVNSILRRCLGDARNRATDVHSIMVSVLKEKEGKLGPYAMKRVAAGVHLGFLRVRNAKTIKPTTAKSPHNERSISTFLNLGWINPQEVNGVLPGG